MSSDRPFPIAAPGNGVIDTPPTRRARRSTPVYDPGQRYCTICEDLSGRRVGSAMSVRAGAPGGGVIVPRPRLFALLGDGVRRQVTLVQAGPGWGKTTLGA